MTNALREQICLLAKSMFDRGLTGGSTGNISARTADGGLLVSPTGTSFGRLDPARLSHFDVEPVFAAGCFLHKTITKQDTFCKCSEFLQAASNIAVHGVGGSSKTPDELPQVTNKQICVNCLWRR
jgi:hypothetical protein